MCQNQQEQRKGHYTQNYKYAMLDPVFGRFLCHFWKEEGKRHCAGEEHQAYHKSLPELIVQADHKECRQQDSCNPVENYYQNPFHFYCNNKYSLAKKKFRMWSNDKLRGFDIR